MVVEVLNKIEEVEFTLLRRFVLLGQISTSPLPDSVKSDARDALLALLADSATLLVDLREDLDIELTETCDDPTACA